MKNIYIKKYEKYEQNRTCRDRERRSIFKRNNTVKEKNLYFEWSKNYKQKNNKQVRLLDKLESVEAECQSTFPFPNGSHFGLLLPSPILL